MAAKIKMTDEQIAEWREAFLKSPFAMFELEHAGIVDLRYARKLLLNEVRKDPNYTPPEWDRKIAAQSYIRWCEVTGKRPAYTVEQKREQKKERDRIRKLKYPPKHKMKANKKNKDTEPLPPVKSPDELMREKKLAAIVPRPNPLTWWITPNTPTADTSGTP